MTGRIFKHFKGDLYQIVCEAHDSEDPSRILIVYCHWETGKTWVRPKEMFLENVERDGYSGPRFRLVEAT